MNPNQAGELLVLMQASWPRLAPDDVSARLWVEDLCRCDYERGCKAFRKVRDSESHPPSWSTFKDAYDSYGPGPYDYFTKDPLAIAGPGEIKPDPERLAELVAEARSHLR